MSSAKEEASAADSLTPAVPAFMRNYHEVLRNDLQYELRPRLLAGDRAGFAQAWRDFALAIAVHAAMEDGVPGVAQGTTAMLDHYFDGQAGAQVFADEHRLEHQAQDAVTAALAADFDTLSAAFSAYHQLAEAHLLHEEEVLQPLVMQLPNPKAPIFREWVLPAGLAHDGFEHFLAHGVRSLAAYGSAKNPPAVATRVFLHSLQAVSGPQQWPALLPVARAAAPTAIWQAVLAEVPELDPSIKGSAVPV